MTKKLEIITEESENLDVSSLSNKTDKDYLIEDYLKQKYEFRFNEIKCKPEYKLINSKSQFVPVDKFFVNSLKRELSFNGIKTSVQAIKEKLSSNFSPRINPVKDYFLCLPVYDNRDYIKELADTIIVVNSGNWYNYLKKWLVACVSNVFIEEKCTNHTCLTLTGGQGAGKTTWLENLCPKSLKPYLFTGKINPENKDVLTLIAEMFLINIDDQLRQLNKKDENEIKNLITINNVKYRRPYDEYIVEYPHLSSFMASVNQNDFLTDTTGSRRFLPFECISIEIQKAVTSIDIDGVWTQAYQLFKSGYRYWFTHEEITELHDANSSFQVVSIEQELLMRYFRKPQERVKATHFYTTTDIKVNLEKFSQQKLSIKKLGEALTMYNFERWQKYNKLEDNYTWVWSVIEKQGFELEKEIIARELEEVF